MAGLSEEKFTLDPDPPQIVTKAKTILEIQHGRGWKVYRYKGKEDSRWIYRYRPSDKFKDRRETLMVSLGEHVRSYAWVLGSWHLGTGGHWGAGYGASDAPGIDLVGVLMSEALEEWRAKVTEHALRLGSPKKYIFADLSEVRRGKDFAAKSLEEKEQIRRERREERRRLSRKQIDLFGGVR